MATLAASSFSLAVSLIPSRSKRRRDPAGGMGQAGRGKKGSEWFRRSPAAADSCGGLVSPPHARSGDLHKAENAPESEASQSAGTDARRLRRTRCFRVGQCATRRDAAASILRRCECPSQSTRTENLLSYTASLTHDGPTSRGRAFSRNTPNVKTGCECSETALTPTLLRARECGTSACCDSTSAHAHRGETTHRLADEVMNCAKSCQCL